MFLAVVLLLAPLFHHARANDRPNIVFLVVESTDGRTWQRGYSDEVIPLPNLRSLEDAGAASFYRHYSNTPVCCPSRATFWSGRHAHHIPHLHNGIRVGGAWNNYEGLPANYSNRIDQVLERSGYAVKISGKTDWTQGSHSLNVRLNSWTMYTRFPYNVTANGGWRDETDDCRSDGHVVPGNASAHQGDWDVVEETTAWITSKPSEPFFAYQGMNIVHPPYATSAFWLSKIDSTKVQVPAWKPLSDLHPCDFQSSMLKGCLPSKNESQSFYAIARRRKIRQIYYAMIAEFDAMVGKYIEAVKQAGFFNNTVFIVTSDHGDMNMLKQQHYKMVPYDASASVPMVIFDGRLPRSKSNNRIVTQPTQLIDIMPTILEYAQVARSEIPAELDGHSLVPFVSDKYRSATPPARPDFVVSQFHGCNIAMSWFLVVKPLQCLGDQGCTMKLIKYGAGAQVPDQLFDLTNDPDETRNLLFNPDYKGMIPTLEASLRSVVDYRTVAQNVADYNKAGFRWWINNTKDWSTAIHAAGLRWTSSWDYDAEGAKRAVQSWLNAPAQILACRKGMVYPVSPS
jgi:arylsulfatase K